MKKNRMMRLTSVLLVLVLLTTSVISGTFAKYVTTDSATDSARVAKWGVTVDVTGDTAFSDSYATDDTTVTNIANSVVTAGATGDSLVAPGTTGSLGGFTISGKPEVAANIKIAPTLTVENWAIDGDDFYCPITITVGTTPISGLSYDTAAAFKTAVENAIKADYNVNPNTQIDTASSYSWAWAFNESGEQTNVKDTALGDLAKAPSISLTVAVTVTQID